MKRNLLTLILLIWMAAACAPQPQPTQQSLLPNDDSYPNGSYPNTAYPNGNDSSIDLTYAQTAAISALSTTLNLPPGQITVISTEAVDWPNGCLGIQKLGVMCMQAIVPGYKIVLEANGEQYEFHTNKDGSQVAQVESVPATTSLEKIVIKQLAANLGFNESDILVVSNSDVEFSDACLGVAINDIVCAQVTTPGAIIVLEVDKVQYEYHVSNDGKLVQPATIALTWTRDGGIAGFCDRLTVFLSGEVYGSQCKSQPNETTGTFATLLSTNERKQFDTWFKELGQVSVDASDPKGVSDAMTVTLAFYGSGKGTLKKPDQQEIFLWAQNLFQKLYS